MQIDVDQWLSSVLGYATFKVSLEVDERAEGILGSDDLGLISNHQLRFDRAFYYMVAAAAEAGADAIKVQVITSPLLTKGDIVGGNCKFPICGNRKPHTLVVGGLCPAFHDVGESNSEGAGHRCMDGRRGCC